jgi:predicted restriction endonuclease
MMDLITETDKIYYWPLETVKIDSVMIEFDRCVKITYTENDIDEIANVFYIKWGFEGNRLKRQLSGRQPDYQTWRVQRDSVLHWTNKFFCPDDEYGDRILNVSWYELYHANVDDVVEKLSKFTGTPSEKFNKDFIVCWRERTHFGLSKIDQLKILANR